MARKNKQASVSLEIDGEQLEAITRKMAITIGQELAKALSGASVSTKSSGFKSSGKIQDAGGITMNESIIPVKVEAKLSSSGAELGKKEISEDRNLSDSKKKLSNLFKQKGG